MAPRQFGPKEPRPRVSSRTEIVEGLSGQWHPTTNAFDAEEKTCPACEVPIVRGGARRGLPAGWSSCDACGCAINLATGASYVSADDEPPPGADTGARGEYVEPLDVGLSRKPRVG